MLQILSIGIGTGLGLYCLFSLLGYSIYQLFMLIKS